MEHARGLGPQLGHVAKGPDRRLAGGIHVEVPGPEPIQAEPEAPPLQHPPHRRHHLRLDRLVKPGAVVGGVVEPALRNEAVGLEVREPGLPRDPLAALVHACRTARLSSGLSGEVRRPDGPEGTLPHRPVGLLEEGGQLGKGARLAFPLDRDAAGQPLVPGRKFLQLGEERKVFLPEDLDL